MAPLPQVPCINKSVWSAGTNTTNKDETTWQDLRFSEKFCEILKIDRQVDCKFVVGPDTETGPEIIFGHKWIFAVESPVFERMFCGDFMEAKDAVTVIRLPDDDPNAFRNLRRMLYNTHASEFGIVSFEDIIELYKICDKYIIKSVLKLCVDYIVQRIEGKLVDKITNSQLITLFGIANELQNLDLLKVVKQKLASIRFPLIPDINNLNADNFVEYIQLHVHYSVTYGKFLYLFNAIERYLTHHELIPQNLLNENGNNGGTSTTIEDFHASETKSNLLERLLAYVDFGKIKIDSFLTGPGVSKILTWQQKYFILSQLAMLPCMMCEDEQTPITIKLFSES